MELYIDLIKAELNTAKLVKRAVQVRGKNGQVFTRMQWVDPNDASTGNGTRHIQSKLDFQIAKEHGIMKHPHAVKAMADQGVKMEHHDWDKHPSFHLPETEESAKHAKAEGLIAHTPHGGKPNQQDNPEVNKMLARNGLHPEIHKVAKGIHETVAKAKQHPRFEDMVGEEVHRHLMDAVNKHIRANWRSVHNAITEEIKADDETDSVIKNYKLAALKRTPKHIGAMYAGTHPHLAHEAVNAIIGDVDRANGYRGALATSNLTINADHRALKPIMEQGYVAATMEGYIKKHMGEDAWSKMEGWMMEHDTQGILDEMHDDHEEDWMDVIDRMEAEYDSIGLEAEDSKPTYVAYNAGGHKEGGAEHFGSGVIKVDDSILKHCTATYGDSFMDTRNIPSIHGMDHLRDAFILKQIEKGMMSGSWSMGNADDVLTGTNAQNINIELQYHHPMIEPHQMEITNYGLGSVDDEHAGEDIDDGLGDISELFDDDDFDTDFSLSDEDLDELGDLEDFEDDDDLFDQLEEADSPIDDGLGDVEDDDFADWDTLFDDLEEDEK